MQESKVYVAGENGLVGTNLIRHLKSSGMKVVSSNSAALDLRECEKVRAFFESVRPELVVLVAAKHGGIGAYQNHPVEYLADNVLIFGNVIRCAYEFNVKRLINIGASCVYNGEAGEYLQEENYDKSAVQKPTEPYGLAKLYGMKLCEYYNSEMGTEFISVLPTNLYGEGVGYKLDESSVIPAMFHRFYAAKKEDMKEIAIWGDGKAHREFLHVSDFSEAISILLTESKLKHTMYNLGSGEAVSINELAHIIADIVGYKGRIVNDLSKPNGADRGILDCRRIRELGWTPKITLETGLRELYKSWETM